MDVGRTIQETKKQLHAPPRQSRGRVELFQAVNKMLFFPQRGEKIRTIP